MILNRIATGIKNQDWFVVVIEIFIVVFGVFIGLQVDDWNEARKDRAAEKAFIAHLHDDLLLAENSASRVLERRLHLINDLTIATFVVLENGERDTLTVAECRAIGDARFYGIIISDMPALTELMETAGLGIIRDQELRRAIVNLGQRTEILKNLIPEILMIRVDLPSKFPNLITSTAYWDEVLGEYQQNYQCDLASMQQNQSFKNDLSLSIDGYDAYLRDGLRPWTEQFLKVHQLVDVHLDINHERETQ